MHGWKYNYILSKDLCSKTDIHVKRWGSLYSEDSKKKVLQYFVVKTSEYVMTYKRDNLNYINATVQLVTIDYMNMKTNHEGLIAFYALKGLLSR